MIALLAPVKESGPPPKKKLPLPAAKVRLFSWNGVAMFWFSGVRAVPVLFVPAKMRSVVAALVGAVPEIQLPVVLQFASPPLPFHVQLPARLVLPVARKIRTQRRSATPVRAKAKPVPVGLQRYIVRLQIAASMPCPTYFP